MLHLLLTRSESTSFDGFNLLLLMCMFCQSSRGGFRFLGGQYVYSNSTQCLYLMVLALSAVLLWDLFLTFDRELECIWKRKWSVVTSLYVVLRYGNVLRMLVTSIPPAGSFLVSCVLGPCFRNSYGVVTCHLE